MTNPAAEATKDMLTMFGDRYNDLKRKADITAANLLAMDLDIMDTKIFFWKLTLEDQGKLDQYEAMEAAGELESLTPVAKIALGNQLKRYIAQLKSTQLQISFTKIVLKAQQEPNFPRPPSRACQE